MKKFVLFVVVVFSFHFASAQEEEDADGFQKGKLFAGGNFGIAFGSYTIISISPQVGYRFSKYLASGIGVNLQYASQKVRSNGADYSKTSQGIAGLNLFTRFYPSQKFLIQVQPEANYIFGNIKYYQPTETKYKLNAEIVPSLLAGGGIVMPVFNNVLLVAL